MVSSHLVVSSLSLRKEGERRAYSAPRGTVPPHPDSTISPKHPDPLLHERVSPHEGLEAGLRTGQVLRLPHHHLLEALTLLTTQDR